MESPNSTVTTNQNSLTNNVVTVPIPILPTEGTYAYVFVKGSLYARDSAIFGCSTDETQALSKRFQISSIPVDNGVVIKVAPSLIINSLAQLGYKVISSTGETEVVWTLQRELRHPPPATDIKRMSSASSHDQPHDDHRQCNCSSASTPATQSLDELEFERGIWTAAIDNDEAKVKTLITRGHLRDRDNSGYTALHYAARAGHYEICRILLEAGIGVNERTHGGGATALHRAAMMGRDKIIKLLLAHKGDALLQDSDGKTALHRAAEKGHLESCRILLQHDASAKSISDNKGTVPVGSISSSSPQYEQLKVLFDA